MIQIQHNRVDAVKTLREECMKLFGTCVGIKETRDFVDLMIPAQEKKSLEGKLFTLITEHGPKLVREAMFQAFVQYNELHITD